MKKMILFFLAFPFFSALSQQITFEIIYGGNGYDEARSVWQTNDGGYIVAGTSGSYPSGNSDIFLLRLDSIGAIQWFKFPGGANLQAGYSVQQTSDGGIIVAGLTDAGDFGGYDVYLMKTDMNGDTLWTKTFGGADWDFGYSVEETSDNGFIIGGTTYSFGKGEQMYLIKTDANGDTAWTKTYGGTGQENAKCVAQSNDEGYILIGYTDSYGAGAKDIYLLKTDANGDSLWSKTFGTVNDDEGSFVDVTSDGGFILCGSSDNYQDGKTYAFYAKLSSSGSEDWIKYIGSSNGNEYPNVIRQTPDGGYAYSGYVSGTGAGAKDFRLLKFDSWGNWTWGRTAGGIKDDIAYSMQVTTDGGFILAGMSKNFGNDMVNAMVLKTDTIGGYYNPVVIGVNELNITENFQIFPNPTSNFANIKIPDELTNSDISIQLADASGRMIFSNLSKTFGPNNNLIALDISSYENGIYFLKIECSKGSSTKRVIISK